MSHDEAENEIRTIERRRYASKYKPYVLRFFHAWPRVVLSSCLSSLKSLKVQKKAFYQPWLVDIWTFPKGFPQKLGPNNALFRIGMQLLCHKCFYKRTFLTENQTVSKMTWQTWHHFTLYFSKFFICGTFSQVFISGLVLGQFKGQHRVSRGQ